LLSLSHEENRHHFLVAIEDHLSCGFRDVDRNEMRRIFGRTGRSADAGKIETYGLMISDD